VGRITLAAEAVGGDSRRRRRTRSGPLHPPASLSLPPSLARTARGGRGRRRERRRGSDGTGTRWRQGRGGVAPVCSINSSARPAASSPLVDREEREKERERERGVGAGKATRCARADGFAPRRSLAVEKLWSPLRGVERTHMSSCWLEK
jgi:hypothetical protein